MNDRNPQGDMSAQALPRGDDPGKKPTLLPELLYATAAALSATAIAAGARRWLALNDLSLIYITAVLFVAVRTRMSVAVYAATLCFLAYNFFFIDPRYTLFIAAEQGVVTVGAFLVVALICGRLANRLRSQVLMLRAASAQTEALQSLGQRLAAAANQSEVCRAATQALHGALAADTVLLTVDDATQTLLEIAREPGGASLDPDARATAERCLAQRQPAGGNADILANAAWWCLPLLVGENAIGVVALRFDETRTHLAAPLIGLAQAMVRDLAQALARTRLVEQLETARMHGETERLRAALLSSVSHDLRSPLSSIIGSAESLSAYHDKLTPDDRRALAEGIVSEGQRLDRYIQNLLDMTRLGHGSLQIEREWVGLDEICGDVLPRLRKSYPAIEVQLHLPDESPLLHVHPALIEQALFNVLDNAAKFSPPGAPLTLGGRIEDGRLDIDVGDRGPGIAPEDRQRVFDMFHSVARGDREAQGAGLGLTICQGIVAAHGGSVQALAGRDGCGATIRITLPLSEPPPGRPRDE